MGIMQDKAEGLLDRQLPKVLAEAGRASVDAIRRDISEPYPPASLPGTPPHFRTGTLFSSVQFDVFQSDESVTVSVTRRGTPGVAAALEFGRHGMAARPFMGINMINAANLDSALEKF